MKTALQNNGIMGDLSFLQITLITLFHNMKPEILL